MPLCPLPKVAYIVPVYNHQKYVLQTLNSILDDNYPNKELLIIDDGSTDMSHEIIQSWIKIHENEIDILYVSRENKGVSITFNELISMSSGQYIIPVASDDYLINNMTLQRVEVLQNNPKKLMLISDAIVVNEDNNIIYSSGNFELYRGNKDNFFSDDGLINEIVRNWSCVGPICIMDKKIYDVIGYYNTTLAIEDWDFYLRASSKKLILFEDLKVAAYRVHTNNTYSSNVKKIALLKSLAKTARINMKYFQFPMKSMLYYKYLKTNILMIKIYFNNQFFNYRNTRS